MSAYAASTLRDIDSHLRIVVGLDKDFQLIIKQHNS